MEEEEAPLEQVQSEVDELRKQLAEMESEKEALMKRTRIVEDRQVRNWKWIQDATKFSGIFYKLSSSSFIQTNLKFTGISVNNCSEKSATFHFHPMWKTETLPTYSLSVKFTKEGITPFCWKNWHEINVNW